MNSDFKRKNSEQQRLEKERPEKERLEKSGQSKSVCNKENPQLNTEQRDNKTEPDNEQDIVIESGSSSVSHQDFTKPDLSNNFMSHLDELLQQDNGFDNYSTAITKSEAQ